MEQVDRTYDFALMDYVDINSWRKLSLRPVTLSDIEELQLGNEIYGWSPWRPDLLEALPSLKLKLSELPKARLRVEVEEPRRTRVEAIEVVAGE
jgi:hypothetical protein